MLLNFKIQFFFILILFSFFLSGCTKSPSDNNPDTSSNSRLPLNDTGAVLFTQSFLESNTDPTVENLLSPIPDISAPGQDADWGRDKTQNNALDGKFGFQFIKLDEYGLPLSDQTDTYDETPWSCVKDSVTGLIWEVKTLSGLRLTSHTYTWYEPDDNLNGGFAGGRGSPELCNANNLPTCDSNIDCESGNIPNCDTHGYKEAVNNLINPQNNSRGLCGLTKWRLPLREELRSIIDYGSTSGVALDTNYFPNALGVDTWTSQTSLYQATDGSEAWEVHLDTGKSETHKKISRQVFVHLVHNPL